MFSNKCTCAYLISCRHEIVEFWKENLKDYCQIIQFPDVGLFTSSRKLSVQNRNAVAIIDALSIASADEMQIFLEGKIISFKNCFFIESSRAKPEVVRCFENSKASLIPFPCSFQLFKNQLWLETSLQLIKNETTNKEQKSLPISLQRFAGTSFTVKSLRNNFYTYGKTNLPLIIQGETGTGKTLAAELIHSISSRNCKKYRRINMPSIQSELAESELFGSVSGAFTGATDRKGIFQEVDGGTVLLDEISEIPMSFQAKLLKFLDSGCFCRVGSSKECHVDVRVISATNVNLEERIQQGLFRKDLYERLKGKVISIPPLNSRKEDIDALVTNYLLEHGYSSITFSEEALQALKERDWSGNVRELEYCLELTCSNAEGKVIMPEDLIFSS